MRDSVRISDSVRITMRTYFSSHLLAATDQMIRAAGEMEDLHDATEPSRFDLTHRGYVLSAVLCGVGFFEAVINELFQDALDGHDPKGERIGSLTVSTRNLMAEYWRATDEGRMGRALDKYQALLRFAGEPLLDEGALPYQDASLAVQLRNAIAHHRPEDMSPDEPGQMEERLKGKFPDNRLFAGAGNPWWPSHCLGVGCARWVRDSVVALTDHVVDTVGAKPNYRVPGAAGNGGT
jgi:hypothetical protein